MPAAVRFVLLQQTADIAAAEAEKGILHQVSAQWKGAAVVVVVHVRQYCSMKWTTPRAERRKAGIGLAALVRIEGDVEEMIAGLVLRVLNQKRAGGILGLELCSRHVRMPSFAFDAVEQHGWKMVVADIGRYHISRLLSVLVEHAAEMDFE